MFLSCLFVSVFSLGYRLGAYEEVYNLCCMLYSNIPAWLVYAHVYNKFRFNDFLLKLVRTLDTACEKKERNNKTIPSLICVLQLILPETKYSVDAA